MKDLDKSSDQKNVIITQLSNKLRLDLLKHGFFNDTDVLNQGFKYDLFQAAKLIPATIKLTAFDNQKKRAIGFLSLEKNTKKIYSIKYVFVDPQYRKMGIATRLFNYAIALAKQDGAKKVNLNVSSTLTKAKALYRKLDFKEIGCSLLGQGFLSGFKPFRIVKRATLGMGCLSKITLSKNTRLFKIKTNSRKNREKLFSIYQNCVDQKWIDFFEINSENLICGSRHIWQPQFFKEVLINDLFNSYILIFNRPFFSNATIEVYGSTDYARFSMFDELLKILVKRGITFVQISLVNLKDTNTLKWFKEKEMRTFQFIGMGKTL